jgi:hypothetical protein
VSVEEKLPPSFQYGFDKDCTGWNPLPPGWWKDFHYYSANNHPLHGIIMCSPLHPLSWIERLWMEIATIGFTTTTLVLHDRWVTGHHCPVENFCIFNHNEFLFSMLLVTIPSIIIWWTLFILFTCKCGHVNGARSTPEEEKKAWVKRTVGATLGYILCIVGLVILFEFLWEFDYETRDMRKYVRLMVKGRIKSYLIFWCLCLFLYFNPIIAWGTTDPDKPQSKIGDLIGLGQWRIEKQRFQVRCVSVANKRKTQRHTERGLE